MSPSRPEPFEQVPLKDSTKQPQETESSQAPKDVAEALRWLDDIRYDPAPWRFRRAAEAQNYLRGLENQANYQAKSLRWTCMGCGRKWSVQMPGFPGTSVGNWHSHTIAGRGNELCNGPIVAVLIP